MQTLRGIVQQWDQEKRVYVDQCGGDIVLPLGQDQQVHSDWTGWCRYAENLSMLCLSVFVENQDEQCAPILIQSVSSKIFYRICCKKGSILLRDINVPHAGTKNLTLHPRCLPGVRFLHTETIRLTEKERLPIRHLEKSYIEKHFANIKDLLAYLMCPE